MQQNDEQESRLPPGMPFQRPVTTYPAPGGETHWPAYSFEQREEYALAAIAAYRAAQEEIKDHEIRETTNALRDIAVQFHATQQLRSRIQDIILPLFGRRRAAGALTLTQMHAIAKTIARRVSKNTGAAPELCYGPALHALQDAFVTAAPNPALRYRILQDGRAIECLECGRTSHNLNDVKHRYCGHCRAFLE